MTENFVIPRCWLHDKHWIPFPSCSVATGNIPEMIGPIILAGQLKEPLKFENKAYINAIQANYDFNDWMLGFMNKRVLVMESYQQVKIHECSSMIMNYHYHATMIDTKSLMSIVMPILNLQYDEWYCKHFIFDDIIDQHVKYHAGIIYHALWHCRPQLYYSMT